MKYRWRIGAISDGSEPKPGITVAVRKISDGATLATLVTDADGFIEWVRNGHPEPFYLFLDGQPGGPKYWVSTEAKTAGVLPLKELPAVLRALGDGVVRGYANGLAVSLVSGGPSVSVASGAALVAGHPFVTYSATAFTLTRPVSGVRTDRVVIRLYPEGSATTPGKADLAILAGTIDAGAPALTQTATVHEVSLATVAVPVAGTVTLTDERIFSGERAPLVADAARVDGVLTTTSVGGEALAGLSVSLTLPRAITYLIETGFSAQQRDTAATNQWVLQATYGSTGTGNNNFDTPAQVAVDGSGNTYTADGANNRIVKRDSSGAFVSALALDVAGDVAMGVAVDSSGNLYTVAVGTSTNFRKWNSAFALQWNITTGGAFGKHIATDGTHVYHINFDPKWRKRLASTGALVASYGPEGSGDGELNNPYGIAVGGGEVYLVDAGNSRVVGQQRDG